MFCIWLFEPSGQFANDRISGQGEMQYADKSVYKGQWVDNQVCGLNVNLLTHNMNSQYNPVLRILDISTPAVITEDHDSLYTTLQMQLQSIVCVFNYFVVSNAVYIVLM